MKINEKNLCMFASSPPVDREGWLNKRGEVNKSWQRRWFVLKGNLLFYFERKGDKEPLGMIILEGCSVELAEEGEQYCFQIIFHGAHNRTYFLSTESQTNMEQWMKALTCAGYDYMKLMVAELQRQLDEIEGCKEQTPESTPIVAPKAPPRRQNPFNRPNNINETHPSDMCPRDGKTPVLPRRPAPPPPIQPLQQDLNGILSISCNGNNIDNISVVDAQENHLEEFNFEKMHLAFGKQVLLDIKNYKRTPIDKPLILL